MRMFRRFLRPRRRPNPTSVPPDVHSTTTLAPDTARRFVGLDRTQRCVLRVVGLRSPNMTSWPRLCHAVPNERPTLPAPMIAILMVAPLRYVRLAGYTSTYTRAYLMI